MASEVLSRGEAASGLRTHCDFMLKRTTAQRGNLDRRLTTTAGHRAGTPKSVRTVGVCVTVLEKHAAHLSKKSR